MAVPSAPRRGADLPHTTRPQGNARADRGSYLATVFEALVLMTVR